MKYVFSFVCLFSVIVIACNKDKFQSKPQLTVKSTSDKIIPPNGNFHIVFEYTDKEGDIGDSLFYQKVRVNVRTVPLSNSKVDTLRYFLPGPVPGFPDKNTGEFDVLIPYDPLVFAITPLNVPGTNPPKLESDSLTLRFAISDRAGNHSDTVSIPGVVVQRN
jgi:hypothetical protein